MKTETIATFFAAPFIFALVLAVIAFAVCIVLMLPIFWLLGVPTTLRYDGEKRTYRWLKLIKVEKE